MSPRTKLLGLIGIAAAPILGSYLLFFATRGSEPWGTTNHGELLDPPLSVLDLGWVSARDGASRAAPGDEHWWLVVMGGERCGDPCEAAVVQMRQLHVLLNRDAGRVRRGLVLDAPVPAGVVQDLETRHPKLEVIAAGASENDGTRRDQTMLAEGVYVIDPHGNVILRYPLVDAAKPVLEDMRKLLKASQIG